MEKTEVFEELYRKYRSRLVWQVRCHGASDAEAHDAVQEAFVAALRAEEIDDQAAWFAWLRTVAVRSFLKDRRRARGSEKVLIESMATFDLPEPQRESGASVGESVESGLYEEYVVQLLCTLPARQCEVFCLHLEGFTTFEIAEHLGARPDAVRKSLSRARMFLQDSLSQGGENELKEA